MTRAVCLLCAFAFATAASADAPSGWARWHVRQDLNVKENVAQPAFLQVTFPEGQDRTYAVGLGVKFDAYGNTRVDVGPFVEYQRNTLLAKEQNVIKAGVASTWQTQEINLAAPTPKDNTGFLMSSLNFKRDGVKDQEGGQLAVSYTHAWMGPGRGGGRKGPLPNLYFPIGHGSCPSGALGFLYSPMVGVELDEVINATDSDAEGTILRGVVSLSAMFLPAPCPLQDRLEILIGWTYRADVSDSTNLTDHDHPLFNGSVSYYFFKDQGPMRKAGISFGYTDGEDPSNGYAAQRYSKLAFVFQVE